MSRVSRTYGIVALVVLASSLLAGCDTVRAGTRCRSSALAQDRTHVLRCTGGRWRRVATKQDVARALAALRSPAATTPSMPARWPAPPPPYVPPPRPRSEMDLWERVASIEPARCRRWERGADLHDCDLSDISIHDYDVFDLVDCCDLREANLRGANLDRTRLIGVDLSGADLTGVSFTDADLHSVDLRGARVHHVDFTGSRLWGPVFTGASLRGSRFTGATFDTGNFEGADFTGVTSGGVTWLRPDWTSGLGFHWLANGYLIKPGVDLSGADLRNADLRYMDLTDAVLTGATISGAELGLTRLVGVTSGGLIGEPASVRGLLYKGHLVTDGARLAGADLSGGDFRGGHGPDDADLRGADLTDATFAGTSLAGSDLRGANITRANFQNTFLYETDLTGAIGTPLTVDRSPLYRNTICPDGNIAPPACWPVDGRDEPHAD